MSIRKSLIACAALLLCTPLLAACADRSTPEIPAAESTTSAPESVPDETQPAETETETAERVTYDVTDAFQYEAGAPDVSGSSEKVKDVKFYRDGMRITGKLYLPEGDGSFPVVVISSGQLASLRYYIDEAETFAANGIACVIYDSIGAVSGSTSDGSLLESSVLTEAADLNVILDSLSALPKVDTEKIFLFGHSIGGLVCSYVGCHRSDEISGMILLEPSFGYPDYSRELDPDLSQVPDVISDPSKYNTIVGKQFVIDIQSIDIYQCMTDFKHDAVIYLGTKDCLGSEHPEYFKRAVQAFPSAEIVHFKGADHYFQGADGVAMTEQAVAFVKSHI